jgi:CheY-like chemotaxis protein
MKVKKVLLIEDFPQLQSMITDMIKSVFGDDTKVFIAGSLEEAEALWEKHLEDVDAIFIDTNLGNGVTTYKLAKRIAEEFNRPLVPIKPLVAISTDPEARKQMILNGCTHECSKSDILRFLLEWKMDHNA